jgi:GNAT superfamily N-acetyltransferase
MTSVTVRRVASKRDETAFIKLPWAIYAGDPNWVPPLLMDRRKLIDRKNNPFYRHAVMEMFLAERGGDRVGRIAAIVNDSHNREHGENIGFFGFFECVDDPAVANALFDAAADWLRGRGVSAMRGPASPSVNDEYGLLIDGFTPPRILMAYNPPYYQGLVEGYGFAKAKDLYAYHLSQVRVAASKLARVADVIERRASVKIRTIDFGNFDAEVALLRELYTRGWERNWGEVPMDEDEFRYAAKDLKAIADPDLIIIAEVAGKPVGFGMTLPDLNQILIRNRRGWLLPALVRILLFRKRMDTVRIVILGVLPEYANAGVGSILFYETARHARVKGYDYGEASWVIEDNVMMTRGAEMMNAVRAKTYRVYQYPLAPRV